MSKLIYSTIMSLDGYIEDRSGNFDWAEPAADVHQFVNDLERPVGTHIYGRRIYETMVYWESVDTAHEPSQIADYAQIWRSAEKIVFSTTLASVSSARTRIERTFDPGLVHALKSDAQHDIGIGGADLAAQALRAGLVDECNIFLTPVVVGGGKRALPDDMFMKWKLLDERSFDSGVVYLRYGANP